MIVSILDRGAVLLYVVLNFNLIIVYWLYADHHHHDEHDEHDHHHHHEHEHSDSHNHFHHVHDSGVGSVSIVREGTLDLQKVMHSVLLQNEEPAEKMP